jgi:3-oxoacyl-[acyl-carrier-protein] synthase I
MSGRFRVVVTGMGVVSCLGNTLGEFSAALRDGRSGIERIDAWRELGLPSQVAGRASVDACVPLERKVDRFVGDTGRFACIAAREAIADAGLDAARFAARDAGAVVGSGTGAISEYDAAMRIVNARGVDRAGPHVVPRVMSSTCAAALSYAFGLGGVAYSPSAACCTSALALGQALQLVRSGVQTLMLAGGSEELHTGTAMMFGAMGALSTAHNAVPSRASRPYDEARDGFVMASGAGVLVLEERDHALKRGARIYAELSGFAQATEGGCMNAPGRASIARVMSEAWRDAYASMPASGLPDYINTHAPSTLLGDSEELYALTQAFGATPPPFSSIKGMTGHALGAAGALDAIATISMMREGFAAGSTNIEAPLPQARGMPLIARTRALRMRDALSVSFGFGGAAACLAFRSHEDIA